MERIFDPRSIVVIGVSERPGNLARNIIGNLKTFGYSGEVYAVGNSGGVAHGVNLVTSVDDVPDGLDLAVILTPAATVPGLLDACGRKGIRRVVVESGGFAEFSPDGRALEARLLEVAHRWGIRIVGPNCIGVVNLERGVALPFVALNPDQTRRGVTSVIAQSGGLSVTYIQRLSQVGVGVNKAISIGNKADLDETDCLEYLLNDPGTRVVLMYLESLSDGPRLLNLARSSEKPIIVHKANTGLASQSIALSHTAAMAGDDQVASAAFRQAGMLRPLTIRDAVAFAQGLALPPVLGGRLLIISRSGGHAVLAADAADRFGFDLPAIPDELARRVHTLYPADVIAPTNPLDLGTVFDSRLFAQISEEAVRTMRPDAVMVVNSHFAHELEGAIHLTKRMEALGAETGIPIGLCVHAYGGAAEAHVRETSPPIFSEIEETAQGLAASREWHARRARRHRDS